MEKIEKLEEIAHIKGLNEEQTLELKKVCYIYHIQKENIKKGSFHEVKYNTYEFSYFMEKIKEGKSSLDIMLKIIDECEEYSKAQITERFLKKYSGSIDSQVNGS